MGLFVNSNVASLNAQRNVNKSSRTLSRSFERLSSGLRINSAKDDAAGLAISDRMTSQIRGLNQAVRNTNDGISLAQTAEGGLAETTSILQRVRELGVQAANDTNTDSDRSSIQGEVDALISELDRIAEKTTFNSQKILDGSFIGARFHVGANAGDTVSVSVRDARSTALGRQVRQTSGQLATDAFSAAGGGASLTLNGVDIRKTVAADDNVSFTNADGSAIAKAKAINDASQFTGVSAIVEKTVMTAGNGVTAVTLDNQANLIINGETITGFRVQEGDADGSLVDAINAVADSTGVVASKNIDGKMELTAEDGRNISVTVNGDATNLGLLAAAGDTVEVADITLQSEENIVMASDGDVLGLGASNLFGVNDAFSVNTIDVSTREGANLAIDIADVAISQVSGIRSELGATQNRLESTINNLAVSAENVSAARSRIMDADFATETAEFTRNQIMQQAGISVLAQANQQPQIALALLA